MCNLNTTSFAYHTERMKSAKQVYLNVQRAWIALIALKEHVRL